MNSPSEPLSENPSSAPYPFTPDKELSQRDRMILAQLHDSIGEDLLLYSKTGNLTSFDFQEDTYEVLDVRTNGIVHVKDKNECILVFHIQDLEYFGIPLSEFKD